MTSNQVFGRGDEGASALTTPAAVAVELQPMLLNKSASSPPCGACVADGVEPGVGVMGSEHGGGGPVGDSTTKASQNNNKKAPSQQEMEEPACVRWFKAGLIALGLAMLAAVLVIMTDVAYVWWQGGNQNGAEGFLQPVVDVFFDRTNSTLASSDATSDS